MKKLTASIIALTLVLTLTACGGGSGGTYTGTIPDAAPAQETATTPAPTPESAPDNGGEATDPTPDQSQDQTAPSATVAVGDIMEFGGYEWRVLEVSGGKALLLSEYTIENREYHNTHSEVTWATCDLRAYLNDEFYLSFSEGDRAKIVQTRGSNKDNQWFGTPGGNDTDDYIFLLSLEEVVKYFGDSGQLANQPTDAHYIDDEYDEARLAYDLDGRIGPWWLRSPGYDGSSIAYVRFGMGVIMMNGGASDVLGVRPALWVNLD